MALLPNAGIQAFISSARNKVEHFLSGFSGYGWKIWEWMIGRYKLEIDDLTVRHTMTVYELIISKIRSIMGTMAITQAHGKIKEVDSSSDQANYLITLEDINSFTEGDFIRMMEFSGNKRSYWVEVAEIRGEAVVILKTEFDGEQNAPEIGDEIIQFGNRSNTSRQSAIYLHADETGQPAIDVMFGINSKSFDGKTKLRLGAGLPGESDDFKGLYAENGMLKFTDPAGSVTAQIWPDGTAEFGSGSFAVNPDKSGYVGGPDGLSWHWDDTKNRFVCEFGGDTVLKWSNLTDEVKENLKGETGEDGVVYYTWIRYANDADGSEMSNDPAGKIYMGMAYNKTIAIESDNPSDYVWMRFRGEDGENGDNGQDANLLPWVNEWTSNSTSIGNDYVISPRIFTGMRDANDTLTGVALGRGVVTTADGEEKIGLFGLKEGKPTFELNASTGDAIFSGQVKIGNEESSRIEINPVSGEEGFPKMVIYNEENEVASVFDGTTVDSINDIFGQTDLRTLNITPFNLQYVNGNEPYFKAQKINLLNFTTESAGILKLNGLKIALSMAGNGVKNSLYSQPNVNCFLSAYVRVDNQHYGSKSIHFESPFNNDQNYWYLEEHETISLSGISIPISKGTHSISIDVIFSIPFLEYGSITQRIVATEILPATFTNERHLGWFFSNGFAIGSSAHNFFECLEKNNSMLVRGISDKYGINVTNRGVQLRLNEQWYTLGVSDGNLTATSASLLE